jgi:iron(III) transport system substrate-binding protein
MRRIALLLPLLALLAACGRAPDVVLYCSLDESFAAPVVRAFEGRTGLHVEAYYDVEADKSVGLRRRLQAEANRPVCDVFWNNEPVQSVVLAEAGLLQPYRSPSGEDVPARWRDAQDRWCGFAARARVIIVNTQLRAETSRRPTGLRDFLDPANGNQCAMAAPLTGTTAAHAAAWLAQLGQEGTLQRFAALRANKVHFGPGNAHVMRLVREGQLAFGWTDTDDCLEAIRSGFPVEMVIPDQGPSDEGLLVIPNTVGLVTGAPHPEAARRLIDFLLSREVEAQLAAGDSAQIPLRPDVQRPDRVLELGKYRLAEVDWSAAGAAYAKGATALEAEFNR